MSRWILALFALGLIGCGSGGDAASEKTAQESDRLSAIKQRSGGDWNRLSGADKDYLVNTLASGSEGTAKMLLGAPKGGPGEPPKKP